MISYPEINTNTQITELPEFTIQTITEVPENHPTRQFFYAIFIYIRQVIKLFFHYKIDRGNELEQFYDELSTDRIKQVQHGKEQDRIYFRVDGINCDSYPLWFVLYIKNDPHEGNIPFIEFIDEYHHSLVSFGISLARNTPIYNYEMCFSKWLPIKNIPAEHVTEDVWKYCQYVLQNVRTTMPEQQFPEPNIKNVRITIIQPWQEILELNVTGIPYLIQVANTPGGRLVVHIREPATKEIIKYFTIERPYDVT